MAKGDVAIASSSILLFCPIDLTQTVWTAPNGKGPYYSGEWFMVDSWLRVKLDVLCASYETDYP